MRILQKEYSKRGTIFSTKIDDVYGSYYEYIKSLYETPENIFTKAKYKDNTKVF